jgi:hypothetical protein
MDKDKLKVNKNGNIKSKSTEGGMTTIYKSKGERSKIVKKNDEGKTVYKTDSDGLVSVKKKTKNNNDGSREVGYSSDGSGSNIRNPKHSINQSSRSSVSRNSNSGVNRSSNLDVNYIRMRSVYKNQEEEESDISRERFKNKDFVIKTKKKGDKTKMKYKELKGDKREKKTAVKLKKSNYKPEGFRYNKNKPDKESIGNKAR